MSPPANINQIDPNGLILRRLFEEVEQHVIEEHTPREISNAFYPNTETIVNHYSFRGLSYYDDPASLSYVVSCSCGRRWSVSLLAIRAHLSNMPSSNIDPHYLLEEFCRRMSDRYVTETEYRTYNHYMPIPVYPNKEEKPNKPKKSKKPKKPKEDKPLKFDNAIEGLEI